MERSVIHNLLMRELRLLHSPVGIHFFFEKEELESFRAERTYHTPTRPLTFCQAELGARMEGITVLLEDSRLWCTDARCVFGMDEIRDEIVADLGKFSVSPDQARRFAESKPRMEKPILAILISPLKDLPMQPDIVHFCCDNMQAYHLVDDWMAVRDIHPFRPALCVNSAVCGGTAFSFIHNQANLTLACGGSYNSGKMERGEINVMIPGSDIEAIAGRIQERVWNTGGASLTRKGHPFPGADICLNCPVIVFKKNNAAQ